MMGLGKGNSLFKMAILGIYVRFAGGKQLQCEDKLRNLLLRVPGANKQGILLLTVDGSEIRRSPVEVGSLAHYLQGFIHPRWCRISEPSTVVTPSSK